jgi:hypothetical protein
LRLALNTVLIGLYGGAAWLFLRQRKQNTDLLTH